MEYPANKFNQVITKFIKIIYRITIIRFKRQQLQDFIFVVSMLSAVRLSVSMLKIATNNKFNHFRPVLFGRQTHLNTLRTPN